MWIIRGILFLLLSAISIFIAVKTGFLFMAWKWILSWKFFIKAYAFRWIQAPLWKVVSRTLIIVFGLSLYRRFKKWILIVVNEIKKLIEWWKILPLWFRLGIGAGVLVSFGIVGFGLYVLPLWLPFLKPILSKVHMSWMDKLIVKWLHPLRMWLKKTFRQNPVFKQIRKPHRYVLYWIVIGLRRLGRKIKSKFNGSKLL